MADEQPDKTTGLTGTAKIVTQLGAVGVMLVFFGWVLHNQMNTIPSAIEKLTASQKEAIDSIVETNTSNRDFYNGQLEKERDRSEKNRTHGEEQIKAAYSRARENNKDLADRIEKNGETQQRQEILLNDIKVLLSKGK